VELRKGSIQTLQKYYLFNEVGAAKMGNFSPKGGGTLSQAIEPKI